MLLNKAFFKTGGRQQQKYRRTIFHKFKRREGECTLKSGDYKACALSQGMCQVSHAWKRLIEWDCSKKPIDTWGTYVTVQDGRRTGGAQKQIWIYHIESIHFSRQNRPQRGFSPDFHMHYSTLKLSYVHDTSMILRSHSGQWVYVITDRVTNIKILNEQLGTPPNMVIYLNHGYSLCSKSWCNCNHFTFLDYIEYQTCIINTLWLMMLISLVCKRHSLYHTINSYLMW